MFTLDQVRRIASNLRILRQDESGAIAVLVGIMIIPLMMALGLVIDVGLIFYHQRGAHNAADAAALAGVRVLWENLDESTLSSAVSLSCADPGVASRPAAAVACEVATSDPYNYAPGDVTVNMPPQVSTLYGGAEYHVEVLVTKQYETILVRLMGPDQVVMTERAVAGGAPKKTDGAYVDGLIDEEYDTPVAAGNCTDPTTGNPIDDPLLDADGFPTAECNEVYATLDDDWIYIALKVSQSSNDNRMGPKTKDFEKLFPEYPDCVDTDVDIDDPLCPFDDWNYNWGGAIKDERGSSGQAWKQEKHTFDKLLKSDSYAVTLQCAGQTVQYFGLDYLYQDGGTWQSGALGSDSNRPLNGSPIGTDLPDSHNGTAASSLQWNVMNSPYSGIAGSDTAAWRSPGNGEFSAFDWAIYPNFWEYRMIYEFKVPRALYSSCSTDITLTVPFSHNSPPKCSDGDGANCPFITAPIEHLGLTPRLRE
jgi:Flp pilus assembly protein TadG